ncbi:MAG: manganese-binding transcriptional regulator MntR [Pseudobdellovibrionaceae bacterium]
MTSEKAPASSKKTPVRRADAFDYVRLAHQNETAEDYVELIAELIAAKGEARVVDLAENFGVSHATVNKIIGRLNREGFVTNRPYRSLFLTEQGQVLAQKCQERHDLVFRFLLALGVDEKTAQLDSEGVEHHVSEKTLSAFRKFLKKSSV